MGAIRKTLRFTFSVGGYDGWSPVAKYGATERVAMALERQTVSEGENGQCCPMRAGSCTCKGTCGCKCPGCACGYR